MNAAEAKQKALQGKYTRLIERIKLEASDGFYELVVGEWFFDEYAVNALKKDKYSVKFDIKEKEYKISWK